MKKVLILLMVLTMVLVGCGGTKTTETENEDKKIIGTLVVELHYPNGDVETLEYPLKNCDKLTTSDAPDTYYYYVYVNDTVKTIKVESSHIAFEWNHRVFVGTIDVYIK